MRRAAQAGRAAGAPWRLLMWWVLAVAVFIVAGGIVWLTISTRAQPRTGPMLGQRIANEGYEHVQVGTAIRYRAHPPASGWHFPYPAPAGVYQQGLPEGFWVHSLEHGYIVLVYKPPVTGAMQLEFKEMVKDFPKSKFGNVKLVVAPYEDMPHPFAVLSWDWRLFLDTFDRAKILEFYGQHVDQGREDLP